MKVGRMTTIGIVRGVVGEPDILLDRPEYCRGCNGFTRAKIVVRKGRRICKPCVDRIKAQRK